MCLDNFKHRQYLASGLPFPQVLPLFDCALRIFVCSALLFTSFNAAAQSSSNLNFLIFEPVPIQVTQPQTSTDTLAVSIVTELVKLPSAGAVTLSDWVATNINTVEPGTELLQQNITSYEASIQNLELSEGIFSEQLPQQLLALGSALQDSGDPDAALEFYDRAAHITRVNQGLFSTQQIPILERIIDNYLSRGDMESADEQQRYMFYLQQKSFGSDSTDLLPALNNFAEWNMFAFSAPPANSYYANPLKDGSNLNPTVIRSLDEANFRVERLIHAQNIYWSIIQILLDNFGMQDPRLLDFEKRLALTNYYFATTVATELDTMSLTVAEPSHTTSTPQFPAPSISNMGYRHGREALERRRNYMLEMPAVPVIEQAKAGLDLADWMLLFNRQRVKSLEMYQTLHDELNPNNNNQEITDIFSPALPILLPSFIYPFNSRATLGIPPEQALVYQGYIDVEFKLNRFGKTSDINVLSASTDPNDNLQQMLVRILQRSIYRPRFASGKILTEDLVQARYYYAY